MIKLFGQYVPIKTLILAFTETCLIIFGLLTAVCLRMGGGEGLRWYLDQPYLGIKIGSVVIVCLICFYFNELYDLQIVSRRAELIIRLMQALGWASLILAALYYAAPDLILGRGIFAAALLAIGLALIAWRLLVDAAGTFFRPEKRVLVLGTGQTGIRLVREILDHEELNFRVVGFLDEKGENIGKSLVNPGIIGAVSDVEQTAKRERIDRIVVSLAERRGHFPVEQLLQIKLAGIPVEDAHSFYERLTGRIMIDMLNPSWLVLSDGFRWSFAQRILKRVTDIVVSVIALILLAPFLSLVALAIWLESGSPIFFRQKRTGYRGQCFEMIKFRSMRQDAESNGAVWARVGDNRITRVGRILRRYRIDEIPQLINVLRGEMSIVGPRPEQPALAQMLDESIAYYAERHSVRPGITGWAQIKYKYGASVDDSKCKLEYDLFYIKHLSFWFDCVIMFRTLQIVLLGRGAV